MQKFVSLFGVVLFVQQTNITITILKMQLPHIFKMNFLTFNLILILSLNFALTYSTQVQLTTGTNKKFQQFCIPTLLTQFGFTFLLAWLKLQTRTQFEKPTIFCRLVINEVLGYYWFLSSLFFGFVIIDMQGLFKFGRDRLLPYFYLYMIRISVIQFSNKG